MTAVSTGDDIINALRAIPDTGISAANIRADDKTPPDAFPAIRVAYLGAGIETNNLREQPANDPANFSNYTYRFNLRVTAEAYITDGDGMFSETAAPGLAEKIRSLPQVLFASNSRRRITWTGETAGEYDGEESEPRPYLDMALSVEVFRSF